MALTELHSWPETLIGQFQAFNRWKYIQPSISTIHPIHPICSSVHRFEWLFIQTQVIDRSVTGKINVRCDMTWQAVFQRVTFNSSHLLRPALSTGNYLTKHSFLFHMKFIIKFLLRTEQLISLRISNQRHFCLPFTRFGWTVALLTASYREEEKGAG